MHAQRGRQGGGLRLAERVSGGHWPSAPNWGLLRSGQVPTVVATTVPATTVVAAIGTAPAFCDLRTMAEDLLLLDADALLQDAEDMDIGKLWRPI